MKHYFLITIHKVMSALDFFSHKNIPIYSKSTPPPFFVCAKLVGEWTLVSLLLIKLTLKACKNINTM